MICFLILTLNNGAGGIGDSLWQLSSWFSQSTKLFLLLNLTFLIITNNHLCVAIQEISHLNTMLVFSEVVQLSYQICIHSVDTCIVDASIEPSMVLLTFQEASLENKPEKYANFGNLPFILETYTQGCSSEFVKKSADNSEILSTHGLIQIAFGNSDYIDSEFLQQATSAIESIEKITITNHNNQPVTVLRRNKSPDDGLISFQKVFDKFGEKSRQTHTASLLFPIRLPIGGEYFSFVFGGAHLTFSPAIGGYYPSSLNKQIRKEEFDHINSSCIWKDTPLFLLGDLNMRTRPHSFDGWELKTSDQIIEDFKTLDWSFRSDHTFPIMRISDFSSDMTWSESKLWKDSEGYELFENNNNSFLVPPNFPPTYQFIVKEDSKEYGVVKINKDGKLYDLRPPSWTEQLVIFLR